MGKAILFCWMVGSALLAGARAFDLPWLLPTPSAAPGDLRPERPLYAFDYNVNNPSTADMKSHWEVHDGDVVRGSYTVVEPDGTLLTVEYTADGNNGFNAVVKRDGIFVKPPQNPTNLGDVPLYWALKPLLGARPTAPPTTTTTTTATPPASAKWPSLAAFDDIYEKFWKTYGTPLYGADRDFFNKPFFPFFSRDDKTTTTTTTAPTTTTPKPPEIPFYYHVNHGDPRYYYKKHPVYYYVSNSRPKYNSDHTYPYYYYVDNSDSKYEYTKSIDPFYQYLGSPSNTNIEKTNISDVTEKKDTPEKKDA